ncbi:MAG: hypothetical protein WB791_06110 [Waddliaceae bacterium]
MPYDASSSSLPSENSSLLAVIFDELVQRGKIANFPPGYGGHEIALVAC